MKNKEENKLYMRKYNSTSKGRNYNRKNIKEWRKKHKGYSHGKRPTSITSEYREAIIYYLINRDGIKCHFCGKYITNYEDIGIDHITPVMLGGKNRMDNLRIAHRKCNHIDGLRVRKLTKGY